MAIFDLSSYQLQSHPLLCLRNTRSANKATCHFGKVQRSDKGLRAIHNRTPHTSTPENKIAKPTFEVGFAIDSAEPKRPTTGSASSSHQLRSHANFSPFNNILPQIPRLSIPLSYLYLHFQEKGSIFPNFWLIDKQWSVSKPHNDPYVNISAIVYNSQNTIVKCWPSFNLYPSPDII